MLCNNSWQIDTRDKNLQQSVTTPAFHTLSVGDNHGDHHGRIQNFPTFRCIYDRDNTMYLVYNLTLENIQPL